MIDQEILIVQHTWLDVAKKEGPNFGELFYTRLFELSPQLEMHLKTDLASYSKKLISVLDYLIEKLDNISVIHEARVLGKKYAHYGIKPEDYGSIKEAFFWALKKKLADKWTPTVMVSWIWFYSTLSCIMKDAGTEKPV